MRVPVEWLKEYVTVRLKPNQLAERLTMAGLEVVGIHDVDGVLVLDIEVTPNRADCLSIIGIAREVAALTGQRLKLPLAEGSKLKAPGKDMPRALSLEPRAQLSIRIEDQKGCQRYIGWLMEGVRIGASPEWMQRRLSACGTRPINTVVDITNYVLYEYGQPLHAFDFDRLAGGALCVRRANAQEPITTLDGIERQLSPETLVIADGARAVAVAGVMGGVGSEVTPQTRRVLLESALFDPVSVRRTARRLGLASESSYRFERGVDPVGVEAASRRAAGLIEELAGGKVRQVCDVGRERSKPAPIALNVARVNRWLGTQWSSAMMRTNLARLSCRVASSGSGATLQVIAPSFRQDLAQEADLAEELARLTGYETIPTSLPALTIEARRSESAEPFRRLQSLRCLCASLGLTEVVTWSLVSESELRQCRVEPSEAVRLANPLSQDHAYLRPSLLVGLLQTVRRNMAQSAHGVQVFELGSIARPDTIRDSAAGREPVHVGIALSGLWSRDWRTKEPCDFFRLKGILAALLSRLCDGELRLENADCSWAEPGQSAAITMGQKPVGVAAQVSKTITHAFDLEHEVWVAELSVNALLSLKRSGRRAAAPAAFPPVKRDLSVLVDQTIAYEPVARTIRDAGAPMAHAVELIDRYAGGRLPSGTYSLTFSIEYRDPGRTLTAAEVDGLHRRIGQTLVERFGATLR